MYGHPPVILTNHSTVSADLEAALPPPCVCLEVDIGTTRWCMRVCSCPRVHLACPTPLDCSAATHLAGFAPSLPPTCLYLRSSLSSSAICTTQARRPSTQRQQHQGTLSPVAGCPVLSVPLPVQLEPRSNVLSMSSSLMRSFGSTRCHRSWITSTCGRDESLLIVVQVWRARPDTWRLGEV